MVMSRMCGYSFWLYDEMLLVQVPTSFWLYDEMLLVQVQLHSGYMMRCFWFKYNSVLVIWWDALGSSTTLFWWYDEMFFGSSTTSFWLHDEMFLVQVWLRQNTTHPIWRDRCSNPWPPDHRQYTSCPWDSHPNHSAIRDLTIMDVLQEITVWFYFIKTFSMTKTMSKILQFNLPVSILSVWINTTQEAALKQPQEIYLPVSSVFA